MVDIVVPEVKNVDVLDAHQSEPELDTHQSEPELDTHQSEPVLDAHQSELELRVEAENDERLKNFVVDEDALGRSFYLQTFVCYGTVLFRVKNILNSVKTIDWVDVPKKRGRKPKNSPPDPNMNVPEGSIKSVRFKEKKVKRTNTTSPFDNTVCIEMILKNKGKNKTISIKVPKTGNIDVTGCSSVDQVIKCLRYLFRQLSPDCYSLKDGYSRIEFLAVYYMRNTNFEIGFPVDRGAITSLINSNMEIPYRSIYVPAGEYKGIQIKIDSSDASGSEFCRMILNDEDNVNRWNFDVVDVEYTREFIEKLTGKETKFNNRTLTWLVFNSGMAILTGMHLHDMNQRCKFLLQFIRKNRSLIETHPSAKPKTKKQRLADENRRISMEKLQEVTDARDKKLKQALLQNKKWFVDHEESVERIDEIMDIYDEPHPNILIPEIVYGDCVEYASTNPKTCIVVIVPYKDHDFWSKPTEVKRLAARSNMFKMLGDLKRVDEGQVYIAKNVKFNRNEDMELTAGYKEHTVLIASENEYCPLIEQNPLELIYTNAYEQGATHLVFTGIEKCCPEYVCLINKMNRKYGRFMNKLTIIQSSRVLYDEFVRDSPWSG